MQNGCPPSVGFEWFGFCAQSSCEGRLPPSTWFWYLRVTDIFEESGMCHVSCVTCHVSRVTCHDHVSCVTVMCHVSRVICHVSRVTVVCHVSYVMCFVFQHGDVECYD